MRSNFSKGRRQIKSTSKPTMDENYDLKGLNLVAPDQVMPPGETPFAINNRRYADNENDVSVAMRTRNGSRKLSTAVGEALDQQNIAAITGSIELSTEYQQAIPFTAGVTGVLTRVDLTLKKTLNTRGYVIIEIYTGTNGLPALKVGQTSIAPNLVTDTDTSVGAYLMDAPTVTAGQQYWIIPRHQEFGVGTYSLAKTAGVGIFKSDDLSKTWVAQNTKARFKTYISTAGTIKGFTKRYPSTGEDLTLFAFGTSVYKLPTAPAVPAIISSGTVSADAKFVRFTNIDDKSIWVDGEGVPRWYDGTVVTAITGAPAGATNVMVYKERLLFISKTEPNKMIYSDLFGYTTWLAENFLYFGRPKSPDPVTAWHQFRESVTVFTRETKYTLLGTNVTSFDPQPHIGTKGAISQEATAVGKEAIYFMADDRNLYAWNGASDRLISKKVWPELKKILDITKVRLHVFNNQLRVYYNRNPDSEVNCMLIFDIAEEQWYKDTGRLVAGSMEWTQDNNELVEFSSRAGWLFFGEQGYSDLGKAIDFKYWTAYKMYGSGAAKDRVKRFRPIVKPAESSYYLSVGKDIDFQNRPDMRPWQVDGGGAKWGSFNWGDGTVYGGGQLIDNTAAMSGRGKHTQFRFEHQGIDVAVLLLGYIAMIKSGRPR